jgi:hypothetical protein
MLIVPRRRAVAAGGWTPAQIPTALWLDASDASTITTVNGAVSEWRDKSGNGRNATQTNPAERPTYTVAGLNGKNILTSTGGKRLSLPSIPLTTNASLFMVINDTRNGGFSVALVLSAGSTRSYTLLTNLSGNNKWGAYTNAAYAASSDIDSNFSIASINYAGTNLSFFKNGATDGSLTVSDTTVFNSSWIFSDQYGSSLAGNIAETIFIDYLPTTTLRQQIEGYLAHGWAQTSILPSNHPYKSLAP